MDEITGSENRIAVERKRFEEAAARYEQTVRRFPIASCARCWLPTESGAIELDNPSFRFPCGQGEPKPMRGSPREAGGT
jgi:hypothetical protein